MNLGEAKALLWLATSIALGLLCGQSVGADLGSAAYQLPLIGRFAVLRSDLELPNADLGRYQLADASLSGLSAQILVTKVVRIAVKEPMIVGTTESGYFMLDTSKPNAEAQTFVDVDDWHAALHAAGVPAGIQLNDPDVLAARFPDRQIHPLDYRVMEGRFGWSDDLWSGVIQWVGLVIIFVRGLLVRSSSSPLSLAVALGLVVNFVTQIVIAGGGPGALVGFIVTPILYCIVAQVGRFLRRLTLERYRQHSIAGV